MKKPIPGYGLIVLAVLAVVLTTPIVGQIGAPIATAFGLCDSESSVDLFRCTEFARLWVLTIAIVLLISRYFILRLAWCYPKHDSMSPTLNPGDVYLVDRLCALLKSPIKRGDLVTFRPPDSILPAPELLKRVIGLPGDLIHVRKGVGVYVNDAVLEEPYISEPAMYELTKLADIQGNLKRDGKTKKIAPYETSEHKSEPIVVPAEQLFVLGDNRNNSLDSHFFGFIDGQDVTGRIWHIWHWKPVQQKKTPQVLICAYCQLTQYEVVKLVAGDGITICNDCIKRFKQQLHEREKSTENRGETSSTCAFCHWQCADELCMGDDRKICTKCVDLSELLVFADDRLKAATAALAKNPSDMVALHDKIQAFLQLQQHSEALDDLNKHIEREPDNAEVYGLRASVHNSLKSFEQAVNDATVAVDRDPCNIRAYRERANAHQSLQEHSKAIQDWTKLIELTPELTAESQATYVNRAFSYILLGQYTDALADCDKAIAMLENDPIAHNNRARALAGMEEYERALPDIEKAIELNSRNHPTFYYNRGLIKRGLNRTDEAVEDFKHALSMNPDLKKAQVALDELTPANRTSP